MGILSRLVVLLTAETEEFKKEIDASKKETQEFNKNLNKVKESETGFSRSLKNMAQSLGLVVGAAMVVKGAINFTRESIQAASDVEEMASKFNTVFRDLAGSAERELADYAATINRSKYDLMGFAATLQDTFVPLGFARDQAAEMSIAVVKLAEDLASFNNLRTQDVVRDLQSALVGNTETLRKYGIVANETSIKAKALAMGTWDGVGAMDAQTKAATILQIAFEGSTDAQGDALRTADSYANVTRGLDAAKKDLSVTLGQLFLPAATDAAKAMTYMVSAIATGKGVTNDLSEAVKQGIITQQEAARQIGMLRRNYIDTAEAQDWLTIKTEAYYDAQVESVVAADDWVSRMYLAKESTDALAEGLAELTEEVVDTQQAFDDLKLFIGGPLGEEYEAFTQKQADLTSRMDEVKSRIDELAGKSWLPRSEREELEKLRAEYAELGEIYGENATAHEEANKKIMFNLLMQRAAIDGVTSAELQLLTDLATSWGLMDENTRAAVLGMDKAFNDLAEGENFNLVKAELLVMLDTINRMAGAHDIHFNISTSGYFPEIDLFPQERPGSPIPQARGGDWMVTQPTLFLAGEAGPERATFTPMDGRRGSGGVSITIEGDVYVRDESDIDLWARRIQERMAETGR